MLEKILLSEIKKLVNFTKEHRNEFINLIKQKVEKEFNNKLKESKAKLETSEQRYNKLDEIIKILYEDNVEGKLSDERFKILSVDYENEQKELQHTINELKDFISKSKITTDNANRFISLVDKYEN